MAKTSIVRNPINRGLFNSRNIPAQRQPSFHLPTSTQYLTVSSEDTSTYTELDDDLVDVDYVSEYSLDLSNDEEEDEV